jgi:rhamnogalacturonan endolyase
MQVLYGNEVPHQTRGVCLVDAKTGRQIWNINRPTKHVGGAMAADIDPTRPGLECFAAEDSKGGSSEKYLLDARGNLYGSDQDVPGTKNWVWWDADRLRETITPSRDRNKPGLCVSKYKGTTLTEEIEGRLLMIGDLYGDWREEIVTVMPGELRIYTTDIPACDRRTTLLQDAKYRTDLVNVSQGYTQSPTPSFYLGEDVSSK